MGGLGSVILESRIRSRLSMFKIFEAFLVFCVHRSLSLTFAVFVKKFKPDGS